MSPVTDTVRPWAIKAEPAFVISRFSCRVVDNAGEDVATIYGATYEECLARAALLVNVSAALATAAANKEDGLPLPGQWLRILVSEPGGAELQQGERVQVIPDPDLGFEGGEPALWVESPGGEQWALDPAQVGIEWETVVDG